MNPQITAFLALGSAVVSACSGLFNLPLPAPGETVSIVGQVRSIDTSPMAYDGPAELLVDAEEFGLVTVYVQSCLGGCALQAVNQLGEVDPGERWMITAEVIDEGSLVLYADHLHALELVHPPK